MSLLSNLLGGQTPDDIIAPLSNIVSKLDSLVAANELKKMEKTGLIASIEEDIAVIDTHNSQAKTVADKIRDLLQ